MSKRTINNEGERQSYRKIERKITFISIGQDKSAFNISFAAWRKLVTKFLWKYELLK
jgi:hypothetical protein